MTERTSDQIADALGSLIPGAWPELRGEDGEEHFYVTFEDDAEIEILIGWGSLEMELDIIRDAMQEARPREKIDYLAYMGM